MRIEFRVVFINALNHEMLMQQFTDKPVHRLDYLWSTNLKKNLSSYCGT